MRLTQLSLANPAAVAIVAAVIVMLGVLSLTSIPAQLLPQIEKPIITVVNAWPGASPREIESELTVPVEEVLQGTPGMTEMISWSMPNFGFMQLEFSLETDMTRTLIEIISRLNRLRPLPANAEQPQVSLGEWGDSNDQLIEYYVQQLDGDENRLTENKRYLREVIVPELASLYGVSQVDMFDAGGNSSDQLQIIVDPYKAAELGIDIAARGANRAFRRYLVGRRRRGPTSYTLRVEGRYDIDELAGLILEWRDGLPIKLGDLATISYGPPQREGFIYHNGHTAARLAIAKTTDANVLEALKGVKARMNELNETEFKERGLHAEYSFDPALYINRSIRLLTGNLIAGVCLAIGVLWLFLRQWRATLIIAMAIPISLLGTFVVLSVAGRSLNVISLAGLAFATGMVLDAAIVVLENIVRLREKGEEPCRSKRPRYEPGLGRVAGIHGNDRGDLHSDHVPEGCRGADVRRPRADHSNRRLHLAARRDHDPADRGTILDEQDAGSAAEGAAWDRIADVLMELTRSRRRQAGLDRRSDGGLDTPHDSAVAGE